MEEVKKYRYLKHASVPRLAPMLSARRGFRKLGYFTM
jgi:hypothetical protein